MSQPITLVIPPSGFLLDERVFMSLGILKVAAALQAAGKEVNVLDLSGVSNYLDAVADYAANSNSLMFGITTTTPQLPAATLVARTIRKRKPDARLILGGPHVTLINAAMKKNPTSRIQHAYQTIVSEFDVLVAGDGEEAIFEALKPNAPKLIDADQPKVPGGLFLTNQQLETLPFPARQLVDVESYRYTIEGERALSLIAQLGCPFACGFCGGRSSPSFRRARTRSSDNIVREMEDLYKTYGVKGFMFYDDELNVNPKIIELMTRISQKQQELNTTWKLRGFVKAELFTDEQAKIMYQAGFRWILTGFESGSPRILENINKKAAQQDNTRCVEIAKRHGLKVKALMSIGHPGETLDTIKDTRDWLLKVNPEDFDVTIITTYPGTPYYDEAIPDPANPGTWVYTYAKTGDKLYQQDIDYTETADYYKGKPDGGYQAYVSTDGLTASQLVSERDKLEKEVREALKIPFNAGAAAMLYEHSMGQGGRLPSFILRP